MKTLKACLAAAAGLIVLTAMLTLHRQCQGRRSVDEAAPRAGHEHGRGGLFLVKTVLPRPPIVSSLEIEAGLGEPVRPLRHRSPEFCRTATTVPDFAVPAGRMLHPH